MYGKKNIQNAIIVLETGKVRKGGHNMEIINLKTSFCISKIVKGRGEDVIFTQGGLDKNPNRYRIDLFEDEETLFNWVEKEQAYLDLEIQGATYQIYGRLYPERLYQIEFCELMEREEKIDSISFTKKNGVRRLYFRKDFEDDYSKFPSSQQIVSAKEPIYILSRQKRLNGRLSLQKEFYFSLYPEISIPLFTVDMEEWAEEMLNRSLGQGYGIEQTNLLEVYNRTCMTSNNRELFTLARGEGPNLTLRQDDLKKIVEGSQEYY